MKNPKSKKLVDTGFGVKPTKDDKPIYFEGSKKQGEIEIRKYYNAKKQRQFIHFCPPLTYAPKSNDK